MRTALSGTFSVNSFVASSPSMPGMRPSMITTCGRRRSASGTAAVELRGGYLYIVLSLRNVGPGIGVLHGGRMFPELRSGLGEHGEIESFRMLTRDIYIPSGNVGFWQIAYREEQREELDELLPGVQRG